MEIGFCRFFVSVHLDEKLIQVLQRRIHVLCFGQPLCGNALYQIGSRAALWLEGETNSREQTLIREMGL